MCFTIQANISKHDISYLHRLRYTKSLRMGCSQPGSVR